MFNNDYLLNKEYIIISIENSIKYYIRNCYLVKIIK